MNQRGDCATCGAFGPAGNIARWTEERTESGENRYRGRFAKMMERATISTLSFASTLLEFLCISGHAPICVTIPGSLIFRRTYWLRTLVVGEFPAGARCSREALSR